MQDMHAVHRFKGEENTSSTSLGST